MFDSAMNRYLRHTLLLAALLCAFCLTAQPKKGQRPKSSKTEMAQKQATRIADELEFANETRDRFIATFVNCQQEMWNLRPRHADRKREQAMTDAQTDSLIRARFDHSQRTLDTRRKYYNEYRKFLTPRQINRVYELERKIMRQINNNRGAAKKPAASTHKAPKS